jgi:general secretion pathway protein K
VLLLVAIMGAIAASAFERLRLSTALATNLAALDQARAYAIGVENLLALRADDLAAEDPQVTTLAGDWNGTERQIPLPGDGLAVGTIRDAGNCFNLNSLAEGDAARGLSTRQQGVEQFLGLMQVVGLPQAEAVQIAASAADWIDADSEPGPAGAEDSAYAGGERPYRAANTLFAEVSELRAVAGVTPEAYERMRPFLCALPVTDLSPINVNTLLPRDAPLIAMLAPAQIPPQQVLSVIARRPQSGWRELMEFHRALGTGGGTLPLDQLGQLQLSSRWFALELRVTFAEAELVETALVDARTMPAKVVVRRWGRDE